MNAPFKSQDALDLEWAREIISTSAAFAKNGDSKWTPEQWVDAAEVAIDCEWFDDLNYMQAEDERLERESREESRRLGCDYADYRYDEGRVMS